jgi:hypothetical protein
MRIDEGETYQRLGNLLLAAVRVVVDDVSTGKPNSKVTKPRQQREATTWET